MYVKDEVTNGSRKLKEAAQIEVRAVLDLLQ